MKNLILILVILVIVGAAIAKIVNEKRKGVKCIGCPDCSSGKNSCSCCESE
ncbi:MAG TPA: FeoB-associated Cys-rich membrane protein [Clostridiales bacterium]|nr:FeoB-associated Cys-rich membrane protein [Clostridiales bacterium]